jgi:hypothetical protein
LGNLKKRREIKLNNITRYQNDRHADPGQGFKSRSIPRLVASKVFNAFPGVVAERKNIISTT